MEKLLAIPQTADENLLNEAKTIIIKLKKMNRRWNNSELNRLLNQRQKELKIGAYAYIQGGS